MTRTTGWLGNDEPEVPGPPMPLTERLLANREQRAGVLETALARSAAADARQAREAAEQALDPDDYAANLIGRGYMPGLISQLHMRLANTVAALEDEEAKIEKAAKRNEHLRRAHEAGRIGGFDIVRALAEGDDGDEGRVRVLQRRAEQLRREIAEANEAMTPPERRDPDPLEAAASRAHAAFVEATRARMAEVQARPPRRLAPPPFASVSRAAAAGECSGPDCPVCQWGRRRDAARASGDDLAPYPPGAVITTAYAEVSRYAPTPACSSCGYVDCLCGVAGAYVPARGSAEVYR